MKNLNDIMKQVQSMQGRMQDLQAKLDTVRVTGQSGGGLVKVEMTGKFALTGISIDTSLMKADERDIVEDLIVAAHADAKAKAEAAAAQEMTAVTGDLPLPPGFKLPF